MTLNIAYGESTTETFITPGNPFSKKKMGPNPLQKRTQYEAGTPWWWLDRLILRLMDRMARFDTLEDYALGYHPLPNVDYRYVKALKDLQKKARTNYCELVIRAVTDRMKVKGFRFGPQGPADQEAKEIWDFNEMDYQSPLNLNLAATFGFCYALVSPADPDIPNSKPNICIEDPRTCITERSPYQATESIAGLKIWIDDVLQQTVAMLYLPDYVYTFASFRHNEEAVDQDAFLTKKQTNTVTAADFELVLIQNNELGKVPLIEGRWQPSFGDIGRSEHEGVLDIQDRINNTVLERMIISKNQAYRQRWASGIKDVAKGKKGAPWDPGADILWVTDQADAKFGDFESADIRQLLEAVTNDIGDMAAITQTPASYLMNRTVNVSGGALTQVQAGLVSKTKTRMEAIGHFYEYVMRTAFLYLGSEKATQRTGNVLWGDPEIRSLAEVGDVAGKWVTAGIPLELVMERLDFTPDEIAFAIQERDRKIAEEQARQDQVAQQAADHSMAQAKLSATQANQKNTSSGKK